MYQALYRKYRPTVFDDVVGQEHITETLKNSLKSGKVFHAYLFTGTRGTGKTTCAKILANAVACENPVDGEPCGECAACKAIASGAVTDISEIDAASNNGINDIRDLKEQVGFLPVSLKFRVYIIDEVHMLSPQAFNALLKTLEEPPAHVVFILATTEVHKLPATILSRCQRFDFHRLEPDVICKRLKEVAEKEGFEIEDDAALKIAALADGGMRDALSILDQCSAIGEKVTMQVIADVCGVCGNEDIFALTRAIGGGKTAEALGIVDKLYRNSTDMKKLIFEVISCFRNLMILKTVKETSELIVCSKDELEQLKEIAELFKLADVINNLSLLQLTAENMSVSAARSDVELAIVRLCTPELQSSIEGLLKRIEALENTVNGFATAALAKASVAEKKPEVKMSAEPSTAAEEIPLPQEENIPPEPVKAVAPKATHKADADAPEVIVEKWPEIVEIVKKNCPLLGGYLVGSKAYIGGGRLLIDAKLSQFKEMINSKQIYRDYIKRATEEVLGVSYNLGPYKPKTNTKEASSDPLTEFAKSLEKAKNED